MESILENIVEELELTLEKAKCLEAKYMGEILAIEKVINVTHKTIPQIVKKQYIKKEQIKQDITKQEFENKVDAFLSQIDLMQKNIENDPRPKIEVKAPEPVIEKKPPIPTINRNEKIIKTTLPAFVPPKNRNEVTGKVTQTTIKTSTQKVFRPELTGMKRSGSKEVVNPRNNPVKNRQSAESKVQAKEVKKELSMKMKIEDPTSNTYSLKKSSEQPPKPIKVQEKATIQANKVKLQTFKRDIQDILQELSSKGHKNRKGILQKMIKQYQLESMGHKKHEEASRIAFIKHSHNYCASRHQVHPVITHKIQREKWMYYPELFQLGFLLQNLESEVKNVQNLKEYRLDPRQEYKICQTASKLTSILSKVEEDMGVVPDQLPLKFSSAQLSPLSSSQDDDLQTLNEVTLNEHLLKFLTNIGESDTLQKQELRGLQVLTEVGVFKSKKSPVLVAESQYSGWREHYFSDKQ